jgi:hypothetical protein
MDWLGTWGAAMGAAWLSGVKLYASVLTLGLLQHFGFAHLPGDLRILGEWWVSRPGESHPEPLSEPCLNVSAHTAPAMEPRRTPICQCVHNCGSRFEIRATQWVALGKCPRSFLYFLF